MMQTLSALSLWLHSLATVLLIGHFLLLRLIYLPAATATGPASGPNALLADVSRRSRRWLYAALIVFAVTGIHLTLISPEYRGIGNFSTPWALLMLLKHIVVAAMIAAGGWFNGFWRVGPTLAANSGGANALARFRLYVDLMASGGILVLLLTAISQAQ